jgi:hypothetical protein
MNSEAVKRLSLVGGTGVFILSLMVLMAFIDPGTALLAAAAAGLLAGTAGYGAGLVMGLAEAPPAPPLPPPPPEPVKPEMEETRKIEPADLGPAPDLDRTVRLDKEGLDYVLPGLAPEDLFGSGKEPNLEDTATLAALAGIEGRLPEEENKPEVPPMEGGPI